MICTPPCSTYTRVRMANMRGPPPPLRSKRFPSGFPWLSNVHKKEADLGTILVDFTIQIFQEVKLRPRSIRGNLVRTFTEHPEDLGAVQREEDGWWLTPASMWQKEEWSNIVDHQETFTVAYNQCCWGAAYRKPTRSVSNITEVAHWGPGTYGPPSTTIISTWGPCNLVSVTYNTSWQSSLMKRPSEQRELASIHQQWTRH